MTLHVGDALVPGDQNSPGEGQRCLCRFDDGEVFAYIERGHEFVRTSDRELWATEHDDMLLSARSGLPLAYRRGKVFFEAATGEPLYYERAG